MVDCTVNPEKTTEVILKLVSGHYDILTHASRIFSKKNEVLRKNYQKASEIIAEYQESFGNFRFAYNNWDDKEKEIWASSHEHLFGVPKEFFKDILECFGNVEETNKVIERWAKDIDKPNHPLHYLSS